MIVKGSSKKLKTITAFSSTTIGLLELHSPLNVGEKSDGGIREQYCIDSLEASCVLDCFKFISKRRRPKSDHKSQTSGEHSHQPRALLSVGTNEIQIQPHHEPPQDVTGAPASPQLQGSTSINTKKIQRIHPEKKSLDSTTSIACLNHFQVLSDVLSVVLLNEVPKGPEGSVSSMTDVTIKPGRTGFVLAQPQTHFHHKFQS